MENKLAKTGKLPTIQDLYSGNIEQIRKENSLIALTNQPPPDKWLQPHPTAKVKIDGKMVPCRYLPIQRTEYLLSAIYIKWRSEIKEVKLIANSVVVSIRLHYATWLNDEMIWEWQDGVGAVPLQTDKGSGAIDFNAIKSNAVQLAAPAAETYAIKDAAHKLGKIFGKDLNRADNVDYSNLQDRYDENDLKTIRKEFASQVENCQDEELKMSLLDDMSTGMENGLESVEMYQGLIGRMTNG